MNNHFQSVNAFLDKIKSISLFDRLFKWGKIKQDLVDAATGLANLQNELTGTQYNLTHTTLQLSVLQETRRNLEAQVQMLTTDLGIYKERTLNTDRELRDVREENLQLKKEESFRLQKYSEEIVSLQSIKQSLQDERQRELEQKKEEESARLKALKETWATHQTEVQGRMKAICQKHTVTYVDAVPFRGDPDNALLICDEHVVFDAKSPAGDDLKNFPLYIKVQAEGARKYAKIDGVKKDVFLVVPCNTLHCLKEFVYNMADYDVYVCSVDALEPLILALCRIEDYEFAEQLKPEDRDNICRIIGKFAHLSKRRIQIDAFFARQFIELAYKCENALTEDIYSKVLEFERSEKLNPPQEKRAKAISIKELDAEHTKIETEVAAKGIMLPNDIISEVLNDLRLYK